MSQEKRVLIVDDALFMRTMLKRIISNAGSFEIREADCGSKALELFPDYRPWLVLLDISMPGMNGIEVLKEIRRMDTSAHVVMCSAIGQESMITEAMENGAEEFIVKPFLPEHIVKVLERLLSEEEPEGIHE